MRTLTLILKNAKMFVHNPEKEEMVLVQLPDAKGDYSNVEICSIKDTVKYLGIPLNIRKL
jgi:hypothetical protein